MAHVLFERPVLLNGGSKCRTILKVLKGIPFLCYNSRECFPEVRADVRKLSRQKNLAVWRRGIYHLSKAPEGLDADRLANSV